jgi:very-short-patch-repair endonuclease
MENIKAHAKGLRKNLTDAEQKLWQHLRNRQLEGYKFRRQQLIGKYIVDFVCFEKKLVVELDGGQHLDSERIEYDSNRTRWLESRGYRVLRFWNHEVLNKDEFESVKEVIWRELRFFYPSP